MLRPLLLLAALCGAALAPATAFEISEILPRNEGGLRDADGSTPGWVEIRNETAAAASLAGWHLTDSRSRPQKWAFPDLTVPAGGHVVVFASGKNRAVAGQELHASFQLDPDGEYLALVSPDGTRVSEYAPYPSLRRNISFARTQASYEVPVATGESRWRHHVPQDGSLGTSWREPGFDDSGWDVGAGPFGFDTAGGGTGALLSVDITDRENTGADLLEPGFQPFVIGSDGGAAAIQSNPVTRTFGGYTMTLSRSGADGFDDRLRATPVDSGAFTQSRLLRDFVFSRDQTGTSGLDVRLSGFPASVPVEVTLWSFDTSSAGNRVSDWSCNGALVKDDYTFSGSVLPTSNEQYRFTFSATTSATGELLIEGRRDPKSNTFGVFLNALQVRALNLRALARTDVGAAMSGRASSHYSRLPFQVDEPAGARSLRLRMHYNDGFAAYLNGVLVAARHAPELPAWNSTATAARSKGESFTAEEIVIPVEGRVRAGANVLAIHALNAAAADGDFLIGAEASLLIQQAAAPFYFATPTPGAPNGTGFPGVVRDTRFSLDRGFYADPISVSLSTATAGAEIRYTTDGSAPTATTGLIYTGPLTLSRTTILRAAAFKPGWIPTNVDTQSYIFTADTLAQPSNPPGWPATWGIDSEVNNNDGARDGTVPGNYQMDPRVVGNPQPGYDVAEALNALPALSLAMAPEDFLGPRGIYQNPRATGAAWERPCSIEFFHPRRTEREYHETCAIEIHGNSSRRPWRMQKHSFRVTFRGDIGAARLRERVFPEISLRDFNKLVLRACFTDSWGLVSWDGGRYRPDDSVYFRDVWMKQSHRDMGYLSPTSRFVHLYVNGLYWGVYNICERVDEDFFASHLGGQPEEWEVASDFVDPDPSASSRWKQLFTLVNGGVSSRSAYEQVEQFLNVPAFIDYYLLHVFADAEDWPHKNGYAARRKTGGDGRYHWVVWDQEIALDNHAIDRLSPNATNTTTDRTAGRLYQRLRDNAEFRLLFADRAHRHLHNDGALNLPNNQRRWQGIADGLDLPIVAESARWGDTASETPYGNTPSKPLYTREADWLPTVASVKNTYLPSLYNDANSYSIIRKLRAAGLYPNTQPPAFSQHGGIISPETALSLTAPLGEMFYTLDGSDPREAYSGAARGQRYEQPLKLSATGVVKARTRNGPEWSALTEALFIVGVPATAQNLVITKIHYHPAGADEPEFVEVMNISPGTIDLTGVKFVAGISHQFPVGTILAPGGRLVVTGTQFAGKLDNGGEEIALADALGADIVRFRYNDRAPWPLEADGLGYALVLVSPATRPDPANPLNWRLSTLPGGSPGVDDAVAFVGDPLADADGDGLPALIEYALGGSESARGDAPELRPELQTVTLPEGAIPFLTVKFSRAVAADGASLVLESSTDLRTWRAGTLLSRQLVQGRMEEVHRCATPHDGSPQFVRLRAQRR